MEIISISIKNFRSIKDITIPIKSYGTGRNKSQTTFLVGVNESGKSAILEAISLINTGFSEISFDDDCFLEAQDETDDDVYIDLYTKLKITNLSFWQKKIDEAIGLGNDFVENIRINSVIKNTYLSKNNAIESYSVKINEDLPFYKYVVNKTTRIVNNKKIETESIKLLASINKIEEKITKNNAKSFIKENQKLLTKSLLEIKIASELKSTLNQNVPKIQIWKSSPEYLINKTIDLNKFKDKTSISIPLKNIFHVYGKKNDSEIKETIEKALSNQARRDELQEKMSFKITKHINKIWKEHKIKIRVSINGSECQVFVEDKDKKFTYFTMSQRSDGFKQFISLILSLSALNESDNLKNKIILIDEPEVHLHPSGVRYMRDEILKIGKNNNVIISTHSHYMVDTEVPERHWIVTKNKSKSSISQISNGAQFTDDLVLSSAFGLNLYKELLPKNIIIVEGKDDKNIISHCISILKNSFFYSLKAAGGASKAPGFARLLSDESIKAFILFDDDKAGKDSKKIILDKQKENYSNKNVFTLKNILNSLPDNSTIEDLLPNSFVKKFFDKEMETSFNFDENKAIIYQVKTQNSTLKSNKQKLDSLKVKLSIEFCKNYTTKEELLKIKRISDFINKLTDAIDDFEL